MASDPFQMVLIHHAFRTQFGALPGLINAVAADDTARAKRVGAHLANMIDVLHHHHAAEDEVLWPRLLERAPAGTKDIRQAVDEHDGVTAAINALKSLRVSWMISAHPALTAQLAARVGKLTTALTTHLGNEEQAIVPLITEWITPDEWQKFIDRGGAYVKPKNLQFALAFAGFVLAESTPAEQERFIASVPFMPRMLLQRLGRRALSSYQEKLYGA
jgi:iron-sulfur cluster repair protein YtfE (RIC family)